jgi:glucokinase
MTQKVLSFDLGGTKIAAAIVSDTGQILEDIRSAAVFKKGKDAVLDQLIQYGKQLLDHHPEAAIAGIASAGPLDTIRGELTDPTNFCDGQEYWGIVPITQILTERLHIPAHLENDAAAAALAEHWIGAARGYQNILVLTLGTGLGTGIICNGSLVRAGRHLHTEAGHMVIRSGDTSAPCGCGNWGCAEAYLSGRNFAARVSTRLGPELKSATAKTLTEYARQGNSMIRNAFLEYSEMMAIAIHNYARIFAPEIIIFTGSFADAADLFFNDTERHLKRLLHRTQNLIPKLAVSVLQNDAGLIGAAHLALHTQSPKAS